MAGYVVKISISKKKGDKKTNVAKARLKEDYGILRDAHAGSKRQISLLPLESFEKIKHKIPGVKPGDFAENITTCGLDLDKARVGRSLLVGDHVKLVITEIGKECHEECYIRSKVGDCIMPQEGVFARVARGGMIKEGDAIRWM